MATFTYAAKDPTGKTVEGSLQANSKGEVVSQLRAQDLIVLRVDEGGKAKKAKPFWYLPLFPDAGDCDAAPKELVWRLPAGNTRLGTTAHRRRYGHRHSDGRDTLDHP